jgi:hypothetical protein
MRFADESRVSALKDQLNLPEKHNTLLCPHIPYGFHMDHMEFIQTTWNPYGIAKFHMDSIPTT